MSCTASSDGQLAELVLALREVRDQLFAFMSERAIQTVVSRHASDHPVPPLHALIQEALDLSR